MTRTIYIEQGETVCIKVVPVGSPKNNHAWEYPKKHVMYMKFVNDQDLRFNKLLRPRISIMNAKGEIDEILCGSA